METGNKTKGALRYVENSQREGGGSDAGHLRAAFGSGFSDAAPISLANTGLMIDVHSL
jgi:hypothetical protein